MQQVTKVVPPIKSDTTLQNFSQIVQANMATLYQAAHVHKIVTEAPASNVGAVGDIYLGDLTTGKYIYVKFTGGWYSVALTAI